MIESLPSDIQDQAIYSTDFYGLSINEIIIEIYSDFLSSKNTWSAKTKKSKLNTIRQLDFASIQDLHTGLEEDLSRLRATSYNVRIAVLKNLVVAFDQFIQEHPDHTQLNSYLADLSVHLKRLEYIKQASSRAHKPLTLQQIFVILDFLRQSPAKWLYHAFHLAIYSGLRVKELENLDISDIDLAHQTIYVREGKGMKSREVAIHSTDKLEEWLEIREELVCRHDLDTDALFVNTWKRRPMFQSSNFRTLNKYIDFHMHWHRTRATFARFLYYKSNHNILLVKEMLGHASIATTEAYLGQLEDLSATIIAVGDIYS